MKRIAMVFLLMGLVVGDGGVPCAQEPGHQAHENQDLSRVREFAAPSGSEKGQDIKWVPRFRALMISSFHQRQSFELFPGVVGK
jgi:hypothetical protein